MTAQKVKELSEKAETMNKEREAKKATDAAAKAEQEKADTAAIANAVESGKVEKTEAESEESKKKRELRAELKSLESTIGNMLPMINREGMEPTTKAILEAEVARFQKRVDEIKDALEISTGADFWEKNGEAVDFHAEDFGYAENTLYYFSKGKLLLIPSTKQNKSGNDCPLKGYYAGMREKAVDETTTESAVANS